MERPRPSQRSSRSGSRFSPASGRRSTGRREERMARKVTAIAQNATETRVIPAEVVRPVFRTKGAEKRALEQEQEERAWDRAERVVQGFLSSPFAGTMVFGAVGALSGMAGHEP